MLARGTILADILGSMIAPLIEGAGTQDAQMRRVGPGNSRVDAGMPAQVTRIQENADGNKAGIIVRFPTPNTAGAIARQQLGQRGLDNGDVGYRGARILAEKQGNNFVFNINGEKKSITSEALMNARGTELANLLGVGSFMELMQKNPAGGPADATKIAPQAAAGNEGAPNAGAAGSNPGNASTSPIQGAGAQGVGAAPAQLSAPTSLLAIPQMMGQPPAAYQMPMQGMVLLPGVNQATESPEAAMGQPQADSPMSRKPGKLPILSGGRQAQAAPTIQMILPGYGVQDMFGNGGGGGGVMANPYDGQM